MYSSYDCLSCIYSSNEHYMFVNQALYLLVEMPCIHLTTVSCTYVYVLSIHPQVVELRPGGGDIPVTRDNCVQYIHLLAHWRLNSSIERQFRAFREGLASVVPLQWLRLFNQGELQVHIHNYTYTLVILYHHLSYCVSMCMSHVVFTITF